LPLTARGAANHPLTETSQKAHGFKREMNGIGAPTGRDERRVSGCPHAVK